MTYSFAVLDGRRVLLGRSEAGGTRNSKIRIVNETPRPHVPVWHFYSCLSSTDSRTSMSWTRHCLPVLDYLISRNQWSVGQSGTKPVQWEIVRFLRSAPTMPYRSMARGDPLASWSFRLLGSFPSPSSLFRFTPAFASPCGLLFPGCTSGGGCLDFFFFTLRGLGPLALFFRRSGASGLDVATGNVPRSGTVGCKADSSACREKDRPWGNRSTLSAVRRRHNRLWRDTRTSALRLRVVSLGGSRIMTDFLIWTIGTAGIVRRWFRRG